MPFLTPPPWKPFSAIKGIPQNHPCFPAHLLKCLHDYFAHGGEDS